MFTKLSTKLIAGVSISIIITIVTIYIVLKNKQQAKTSSNSVKEIGPATGPAIGPAIGPGPTFENNIFKLLKWTTFYNGIDLSKSIVNVSKFRQLNLGPNKGKSLVISSTPFYRGNLFLMDDLTGTTNQIINQGEDALVDINEYTDTNNNVFYLAAGANGGGYWNADVTKFTKPNTPGGNMTQLLYSRVQNIYSCISGGSYWVSTGNITDTISGNGGTFDTPVDGPGKKHEKHNYVKMIELNDGRVLLATREKKFFISPTMANTDHTKIKEILAPVSSIRYTVSDFTQLKDGTIVTVFNSGNIFIKSPNNLTNKDINWTKIHSVNNLATVTVQIVELSDGTIVSVGSDGFLYFLS